MGKTYRGEKGSGFEYWSKRPGTKAGLQQPGRYCKKQNNRIERRQGKRITERSDEE